MSQIARIPAAVLAVATALALGGCASTLSGVGGAENYACKAPVGAQCTSVSGVYANAPHSLSAGFAGKTFHTASPTVAAAPNTTIPASTATVATATSTLRTNPRVLRLWIAPWEDGDGDLHDASFVHVVVDTGHWLIDRVRPAARSRLDVATPPLIPPTPSPASTSDANPSSSRGASPQSLGSVPDAFSAER